MKKFILSTLALAAVAMAGAQTPEKNIRITDKDGNNIEYKGSEVEGVIFSEAPEYINLSTYLNSGYEETSAGGFYKIELGTAEADENGLPANVGDLQVVLELCAPWSDNISEPILPNGYYQIGNGTKEYTFDVNKSAIWVRADVGSEGVAPLMIVAGTVDVRHTSDGKYDIRMEFITMSGELNFRYQGEIPFPAGMTEFQPFTEPVDITFQGGQGRFYSNWYYPFASDLSALFYKGTVQDNTLIDGYQLHISFYEPKVIDEMNPIQRIADGIYTVEPREAVTDGFLPFRYDRGKEVDFMGQSFITGTRLEYYDPDGSRKLGLITGGTFTVSDNGTNFVFDFTTAEGVSIKGTYTGNPYIGNYCDNDEKAPKRPYTLIDSDRTLSWAEGTMGLFFNDGHALLEDANSILFLICRPDMDKGQYLQFEVLTENEEITDGVYNINWTLEPNTIIPGIIDYGRNLDYSWWGDLDTADEEGYQSDLACIASGTVTVSTNADGSRKVVCDLTDDAGNKITGEYNGPIVDITHGWPSGSKIRNIRKDSERRSIKRRR